MNVIYEVVSGSHAYGLDHPGSDKDVRGIFVPSARELLGFGYKETKHRKPDNVYHSLRKFVHLALKANPSILAWLWVRRDLVRLATPCAAELRANRDRLLSRLVYKTFGGYARSQLKKMEKSVGAESGYALHGERDATSDPGSRRAGYDTKNAMHLVRILNCGLSLLKDGEYRLDRRGIDDDFLRAIRAGGFSIGFVLGAAEDRIDEMDRALERSPLVEEPDWTWWEEWLVGWHRYYLEEGE